MHYLNITQESVPTTNERTIISENKYFLLQGLKAFWEHLEVEHGIIELLCPGCEKTGFPDKQTLRRHVKTYHGVKLPCEFCGKFFNEGNKMRRHVIEGKLVGFCHLLPRHTKGPSCRKGSRTESIFDYFFTLCCSS